MSKYDIAVGDDFPLDEGPRGGRHHHRRHGHHHGHHHRHHRHGAGRFALLLVIAGLVALIVNHQLTTTMAFGLIGAGAALLVLGFVVRAVLHWRHHRAQKAIS